MRVLFLPIPAVGHAFPAVPLAWALRSAGHDVLFGTAGAALIVEKAGLPVADIAPGLDMRDLFMKVAEREPELVERMRSLQADGGIRNIGDAARAFAMISEELTDPIVDLASEWHPDVIVYSPMNGGGLVAAAKIGVPALDLGFGFGRTGRLAPSMFEHMTGTFAAHGADGLPERRNSIDVAPASMIDGEPDGWPMRYVPYNGGTVLPDWLGPSTRVERPRIGVTLGTVSPMMGGLTPIHPVIAAARELDAEFVLALGDVDTSVLGELPPNVRVAGWLPISALLPTCAALIHHGGAGTTLSALDAGVAQLVLPDGADRYINAAAVTARGAGFSGTAEDVDPVLIEKLITDESVRANAMAVRDEIHAMPTPASIVPHLEDLAASS